MMLALLAPALCQGAEFGNHSTARMEAAAFANRSTTQDLDHMATCQDALFAPGYGVFSDEGGFQNSPHDTGNFYHGKNCGGTNLGVACGYNIEFFRKLGVKPKDLTKSQATTRYENNECAAIRINKLKGKRNPAALLGYAVNQGAGTAVINLKETRNAYRHIEGLEPLPVNTIMDDDTIDWYNGFTVDPDRRLGVLCAMSLLAIDRATDIVDSNPRQAANLMEWVTRWNPLNFKMPAKVKKAAMKVKPVKKKFAKKQTVRR
jgi:hypothetical protein